MRYIAAYLLLQVGGNPAPKAADIKKVLAAGGVDCDDDRLDKLISELEGKNIDELVAAGSAKLSSVPSGGAVAVSSGAAPVGGGTSAAPEAKEEKKEEPKEESDDDMACDPCHKSKRRCDGTLPCANCDFAGKQCLYTDAAGHHVPPPIERAQPSSSSSDHPRSSDFKRRKAAQTPPSPDFDRDSPAIEQPSPSPISFKLDSSVTYELVNLFFAHAHPYNLVIHRPSFLNDLAANRVPDHLLLAILALAAPFSNHPLVKADHPHRSGEKFAHLSKHLLLDPQGRLKLSGNLEIAQALTLLTLHDCIGRQSGRRTDHFMRTPSPSLPSSFPHNTPNLPDIALDILVDLGVHSFDLDDRAADPSREDWIKRESARRLFYLIYMVELLASAFTHRPISHNERDIRVYLPVPEHAFELASPDLQLKREYLLPLISPADGKSSTAEFGFLVRVVAVYTRINDNLFARTLENDDSPTSSSPNSFPSSIADIVTEGENALNAWEQSLPEYLQFNAENLRRHITALDSGANVSGWLYCYMHAIAECCVLTLHEVRPPAPGPARNVPNSRQAIELDPLPNKLQEYAQTRKNALDNLLVILKSLTVRGRMSIMMGMILETATKHHNSISGGHGDALLTQWCTDYESLWGVNFEQLSSVEFRKEWVPDYPQDRLTATTKSGPGGPQYPGRRLGGSSGPTIASVSDLATRVASPPADSPLKEKVVFNWPSVQRPQSRADPYPVPSRTPSALSKRPMASQTLPPLPVPVRGPSPSQPISPSSSQYPPAHPRAHSFPQSRSLPHWLTDANDNWQKSRATEENCDLPPPRLTITPDIGVASSSRGGGLTSFALPSLQDVGLLSAQSGQRDRIPSPASLSDSGEIAVEFGFDEDDAIEELIDDLVLVGLERCGDRGEGRFGVLIDGGLGDLGLACVLLE
ncbi:hypothetical protein FRB99_006553 [Tulasnella sp. 403]|nr:hypothetical protein FRB99_006553 [Tulasnella sp. 403]